MVNLTNSINENSVENERDCDTCIQVITVPSDY